MIPVFPVGRRVTTAKSPQGYRRLLSGRQNRPVAAYDTFPNKLIRRPPSALHLPSRGPFNRERTRSRTRRSRGHPVAEPVTAETIAEAATAPASASADGRSATAVSISEQLKALEALQAATAATGTN